MDEDADLERTPVQYDAPLAVRTVLRRTVAKTLSIGFNRLKQTPGPARQGTIEVWTERLAWLTGLVDPAPILSS